MQLSSRKFQQLRWKLTFSYTIFIPLIMLIIEVLIVLLALVIIELFFVPQLVLFGLQQYQIQLQPFFVHSDRPDEQALAVWMKIANTDSSGYKPYLRAVVGTQGQVIVSTGSNASSPGIMLQTRLSAQSITNLQLVLAGKTDRPGLVNQNPDGSVIAILPIYGDDKKVYGALVDDTGPGLYTQETWYWIKFDGLYILMSVPIYIFLGVLVALIGGFVNARSLTSRLNKLALAADNWSQGDFSTFIQDSSGDEIGQLARQLNRMAERLQNLLQTRQKLAVMEERNRLARDLHDSVKQHIFVIALQVGTAKLKLGPQEGEARRCLTEAEHALLQSQQELTALIHELRPIVLADRGLSVALRALAQQWIQQTGIVADVRIEYSGKSEEAREEAMPLVIEEALFRIAQEALSNIVRHSRATAVAIRLIYEDEKVTMSITDNGQGFDVDGLQKGDIAGIGLHSIRERMKTLGGIVNIESADGKGTSVVVCCKRQYVEV